MADIGDAWIDVHANTDPFDRELTTNLDHIADSSEKELTRSGRKMGDKVSDGLGDTLKRRGKTFARSVEEGTRNTVIRIRSIFRFDHLRDSIRRRFRRDLGPSITEEVGDAINAAGRSGILNKLTSGIADAVGAGFNVSGRSPLIAILIPALLALVGVIAAAVQAVNALVAVLFIIPGLLASIALQAGVTFLAFKGIGTAIQGAFAAKNAKELEEALKDLTPAAKEFVRQLLPLRDFFKQLQTTAQEKFFSQLLGIIPKIQKALGPSLVKGFGEVAAAAGAFFRSFGELLASPGFKNFFNKLVPTTVKWLDGFAHSLFGKRGFVTSLLAVGTSLMPFMQRFGEIILRNLDHISGLLFQLASSPETQIWLDRMASTLQLIFDLLFKVGEFLFVFMRQLDAQGGQAIFTALMEALDELMFFLSSPVGAKAMEALVNLGIIGIKTLVGLAIAILSVLAAFQVLTEWLLDTGIPGLLSFFQAVGQGAVDFANFIGAWIERIIGVIGGFLSGIRNFFKGIADSIVNYILKVIDTIKRVIERIRGIPGQVISVFKSFGSLLINSGRSLIQGLIDGIRQKIGPLLDVINYIVGQIGRVFPGSPAKEGPLSGEGYVLLRGQRMMQDFIRGIQMEVPSLREATTNATSNITFGRGAIEMSFQGQLPTETQARTAGAAVGQGAANMIAARNTRLAVRTL